MVLDPTRLLPEKPWRLGRSDYDRIVDTGALDEQRVELLHGVIVEMSPQGAAHAYVVEALMKQLVVKLGARANIRCQAPLALTEDSEPEPDVYLAPPGAYSRAHPTTTLLVIEVALTSMNKDQGIKAELYATAAQPEYWLIDLENRCVLVHRAPKDGRYSDIRTYADQDTLAVERFDDVRIAVADILPLR